MATRDVQLIIRARDEASRALAQIADQLGRLDSKQHSTAASGASLGASLAETVQNMAAMERATGLVVAASDRAEAAINGQRAAVRGTATDLAAVTAQLNAARNLIGRQQEQIVATLFKGGDASALIGTTKAAQAAVVDLVAEEGRLTGVLARQQGVLDAQESNFRELASMANSAEAALGGFGDEAARAALKAAAATEQSTAAARAETAAIEEQNRALRARSSFQRDTVSDGTAPSPAASKTLLADTLREIDATERAAEEARARADAEKALGAALEQRARFENAVQSLTATTGQKASDSALADQLREEEAAAQAMDRQAAAVQRLQDRIDPLGAIERRVAIEQKLLTDAWHAGTLTAKQYETALEQLGREADLARQHLDRVGRGEKGKIGLFGLKPYELTNLGYQVNDLVTQIASGTSVTQAFAQQGGQILQLLPRLSSGLLSLLTNPYALAFAAAMGAVALAVREAASDAERLRKMEGLLSAIGDGAGASAEQLTATAEAVERIGLSADEAFALVRTFVTQGLNVSYLQDFAEAARDLADVTGKEVPDAIKQQVDAFTKGYDAVATLDDQLQFLTVTERENIRAMFDSGDASKARAEAFAIFRREMDEQATKANGPWKNAVRTLERSFGDLFDTLGETDFATSFVRTMEGVVKGVEDAFTRIDDANLAFVERRIKELEQLKKDSPDLFDPNTKVVTLFGGTSSREELEQLKARRAAILANKDATGDLRNDEAGAAKKRENDAKHELAFERTRSAAERIRLAGVKAYNDAQAQGLSQAISLEKQRLAIEKQRIEERKKAEADFADRIANNGRDGLLSTAQSFVGRSENRSGDRSVLQGLFKAANLNIDPKMTAWCAAFVNAVLATNGLPTVSQATGGSDLRARDFLGFGSEVTKPEPGDIVILKRGGGGGQGHVGFFQGFTDSGDVRVLGGNQSNGVNTSTFKASSVLGFRRAPSLGEVAEDQLKEEQKRLEAQQDLNEEIDRENILRVVTAKEQARLAALSGLALLEEQKDQAIEKALRDAREQAARKDIELTEGREAAIRDAVAAEFDLTHARERAVAVMEDASTLRNALVGKLDLAQELGDPAAIAQIETQLRRVEGAFADGIRAAIAYYTTLGDNETAKARIAELETALARIGRDRFNRERARVEKPVNDLQAQRNGLLEQVRTFADLGETAVADQLREQLRAVDAQFLAAIDRSIEFWKAQTGPEAQAAILNLQNLRNQVLVAQNEFVVTAKQVQDAFAGSLTDAFDTFAQKLVETKDPLQALGIAALQFAADFTKKLADMGIQILAFKLASKIGFGDFAQGFNGLLGTTGLTTGAAALSAAGGAVTAGGAAVSGGAAALGASAAALQVAAAALAAANAAGGFGVLHGGGVVGGGFNRTRTVSPAWFAAATRYHSGGVAGLRPDEVPAILQRGEEVITRSDSRHRLNGRGQGRMTQDGGFRSISQVLAIGDDQIASALRNAAGERMVLTHLKNNKETVRTMLND